MTPYLSKKIKVLSFVLILMVVYIHSYNLPVDYPEISLIFTGFNVNQSIQSFISCGIAKVAVPLFFIISGYLFFLNLEHTYHGYYRKLVRRVRSLFIPYLLWSVWGLFFFFMLQSIPYSRAFFSQELIVNYSLSMFLSRLFVHPFAYQLWFIRDLMIIVLFSPIIYRMISSFSYASLIPFFLIWYANIDTYVSNIGIFFFILGAAFALKKPAISWKAGNGTIFALIISWLAIMIAGIALTFSNSSLASYVENTGIIVGLLAVWFSYDVFVGDISTKSRFFLLTPYTFFVYASHEPIITIVTQFSLGLFGTSTINDLSVYLIAPMITVTCSILVGYGLRNVNEPFYSLITGGRG